MADLCRRPELAESADRFRRAVEAVGSHAEIAHRIGISRACLQERGPRRPSRRGAAPAPAGDPRLAWLESERDIATRAMLDAARRVESFTEAINALKAVAK